MIAVPFTIVINSIGYLITAWQHFFLSDIRPQAWKIVTELFTDLMKRLSCFPEKKKSKSVRRVIILWSINERRRAGVRGKNCFAAGIDINYNFIALGNPAVFSSTNAAEHFLVGPDVKKRHPQLILGRRKLKEVRAAVSGGVPGKGICKHLAINSWQKELCISVMRRVPERTY